MAQCQTCHGERYIPIYPTTGRYADRSFCIAVLICPDCGGSGIEHCCDGLQEQPEPKGMIPKK